MNNIKFLLTLVLCFFCALAANAQKRISGRVWSKADGPIVMAYVVEQDKITVTLPQRKLMPMVTSLWL